jgi:hypothetical protein
VLIYQMVTGELPGGTARFPADPGGVLQDICKRATSTAPDGRHGSMRDLIGDLKTYLGDSRADDEMGIPSIPPAATPQGRLWVRYVAIAFISAALAMTAMSLFEQFARR